jgi:hypothetical protein
MDVVIDGLNLGYWRKGYFDWQQVLDVMKICKVRGEHGEKLMPCCRKQPPF